MGRSMHPDLGVAHERFIPVQLFVLNVRFSILKPTVLGQYSITYFKLDAHIEYSLSGSIGVYLWFHISIWYTA